MDQNFIQHGDDFITITGNARCTNGDCPYIDDIGICRNINVKCEYEKQRYDALLHYGFADNKPVTMELRYKDKQIFTTEIKS